MPDEFGGIEVTEKSETDEFGGVIAHPPTDQKWEKPLPLGQRLIDNYARPTLQGLGSATGIIVGGGGGGVAGTAVAPGPGTIAGGVTGGVAGGGIGYAIGDEIADLLQEWMGYYKPLPIMMNLKEAGKNILEGTAYEAGGYALGPAAKLAGKGASKIPGVGRMSKWVGSLFPKTDKRAQQAAGKALAAVTDKGPIVAKNIEEAQAIEELIGGGFKFDLGQLTGDVDVVKFMREGIDDAGDLAVAQAEQAAINTKAINDFIKKSKGKGTTEDLIKPLSAKEASVTEAEEIAKRNLERQQSAKASQTGPMDIGGTIRGEMEAGETVARKKASEMFDKVPNQTQIVDDLYDEFNKIMKPKYRSEGRDKFPDVLKREIKAIEGSLKKGGKDGKVKPVVADDIKVKAKADINDAKSLKLASDMHPSWSGKGAPNVVKAPRPGETWYRGGNIVKGQPSFFTRDKTAAEWYALNHGSGKVIETELNVVNPARLKDFLKVVKSVGATADDIKKHSPYDGTNELDFIYVPKVAAALKKKGFDGVLVSDVISNESVDTLVPLLKTKPKAKPTSTGEPTMSLRDMQGLRSEILEDLRTAKDKGMPRSLRARLAKAVKVIDQKLGGTSGKPTKKGETIYHISEEKLKGGKPDFDAYYGTKGFKKEFYDDAPDHYFKTFGDNVHAVELHKNAKILDLTDISNDDTLKFMATIARKQGESKGYISELLKGDKMAVDQFNEIWKDSPHLAKTIDEYGYDGARLLDEFYIPAKLGKKLKVVSETPAQELQAAQKFFREEVIEKYGKGSTGAVLRGEDAVQSAMVAGKFFRPGPAGEQAAAEFIKVMGDNPTAKTALREHINQSMLDKAVSPSTGEVTKAALNRWLKSHRLALKKLGMTSEFDSLVKARAVADKALASSKEFEKSAASRVLNADVNDVVKQAFSKGSKKKAAEDLMKEMEFIEKLHPTQPAALKTPDGKIHTGTAHPFIINKLENDEVYANLMERYYDIDVEKYLKTSPIKEGFVTKSGKFISRKEALADYGFDHTYGDPLPLTSSGGKALAGLQNAMVDEILTEIPLEGNVSELLTSSKMAAQLRKYDAALKVVFKDSPKKLKAMHTVRRAVKALEYKTGQSAGSEEKYATNVITRMAIVYGHSAAAATDIARKTAKILKGASKEKIYKYINRGILDPEVAFNLVQAAKGGSEKRVTQGITNSLIRLGLIAQPKEERRK